MKEKVLKIVMSLLGIEELPTKEGKLNLSVEQRKLIETELGKFGADFMKNFEAMVNADLANNDANEKVKTAEDMLNSIKLENGKQIELLKTQLQTAELKSKELEGKVQKLIDASETDIKPEASEEGAGKTKIIAFKPNMKLSHNMVADGYLTKKMDISLAGDTIDVSELAQEFGSYMSQFGISLEVLKKLTQKTETENYMTTKLAISEWKASQGLITSVVQQFTSKWTPLGEAKFTPLVIKNYRHKINVPITPDDIMDSWLANMYDEGTTPEQMPITQYIIENFIIPKVEEDVELRLIAKGVFEAVNNVQEGNPGQATGKSMDGFLTTLRKEFATGTSNINFIDLGIITDENVVDKMNDFVDAIDPLYAGSPMPVFCSLKRYKQYKRAYQKLYPNTKNQDKTEDNIDFSPQRIVPLPSMAGEDIFFCTPKENFILLRHKNQNASKIFMQTKDYDVKVFAEFWKGCGFAVAEAVFAYVPSDDSQSGS